MLLHYITKVGMETHGISVFNKVLFEQFSRQITLQIQLSSSTQILNKFTQKKCHIPPSNHPLCNVGKLPRALQMKTHCLSFISNFAHLHSHILRESQREREFRLFFSLFIYWKTARLKVECIRCKSVYGANHFCGLLPAISTWFGADFASRQTTHLDFD